MTSLAGLQQDFAAFATLVLDPDRLVEVASSADTTVDWLSMAATTSIAESRHTLHVIERQLDGADRLLEVGSGLGITSAFLASKGFPITSIEPGGSGFEQYERVNPLLRASLGVDHTHHIVAVEDVVDAEIGGPFDLIFSNNVIEHVDDVTRALTSLNEILADGGVMIHHCPNYRVPYEPHFGIPLLPWRPAATARLLPDRITASGLWASLNFVTARTVTDAGETCGANVEFEQGMLADAFDRLREPEFGDRHPLLRRFAAGLSVADPLVRKIPASWSTPMTFRWEPSVTRR